MLKEIKNGLKEMIHVIFRTTGYDFVRYTKERFLSLRWPIYVKSQGINLLLDIGANDGSYGLKAIKMGYTGKIVSFEPLSEAFRKLEKVASRYPSWVCLNLAVGEEEKEVELNVSKRSTSSSFLPMTEIHLRAAPDSEYIKKEIVKMCRLDDALLRNGIIIDDTLSIYMKLDCQGYEKKVFEGASLTLQHTKIIECELSFQTLYEGSALFLEMIGFLSDRGFQLVSIEPVLFDPESFYLLQADGIFIKFDKLHK